MTAPAADAQRHLRLALQELACLTVREGRPVIASAGAIASIRTEVRTALDVIASVYEHDQDQWTQTDALSRALRDPHSRRWDDACSAFVDQCHVGMGHEANIQAGLMAAVDVLVSSTP